MEPPIRSRKYTYEEMAKWEGVWELIDGVPYNMSPSPLRIHQEIVGHLFASLYIFLKNTSCRAYVAPFDVRFSDNADYDHPDHVVQPDISVFCHPEQLDKRGAKGAPTMVVEVLSRATAGKDRVQKLRLYEKYGVSSYWIIHPDYPLIEVFELQDNGKYGEPQVYAAGTPASTKVLEGFTFTLEATEEEE